MSIEIESIVEELFDFEKNLEKHKENLENFYKNKNISLEERWEVFTKLRRWIQLYNTSNLYPTFKLEQELGIEIFWTDDFYIERYENVNMVDIINTTIQDSYNIKRNKTIKILSENIDKFKEEILERNFLGFIYNW